MLNFCDCSKALLGCQSMNRNTTNAIGNQIIAHTQKKVNILIQNVLKILINYN